MSSYQLQQLLFYIGLSLVAVGVLLAGGAFYMFRKFDILDIRDDLSGKKRAEGVAKMLADQATGRQAGKSAKAKRSQKTLAAGQTTGSLDSTGSVAASTGDVSPKAENLSKSQKTAASQPRASKPASASTDKRREVAAPIPQLDEPETTVMDGDDVATTVLGETASDKKQDYGANSAPVAEGAPQTGEVADGPALDDEGVVEEASVGSSANESDTPVAQVAASEKVAALEDFHIVRKIVLTDSAEYVRVERGDIDG